MDVKQAKEIIKNNYPPENYTMLREALDWLLEQAEKVERYEKALKFYADKERYEEWNMDSDLTEYIHDIDFDGGDIAREVLGISQTEND